MKIQHTIVNATTTHHAHIVIKVGRKKYMLIDTSMDNKHIPNFINNPQYYIDAIVKYLVPSLYNRINFYSLQCCINENQICSR